MAKKKRRTPEEIAAARELERQQREDYEVEHPVELFIGSRLREGDTYTQISGHLNRIYNPPPGLSSWDLVTTVQAAPRPSWATEDDLSPHDRALPPLRTYPVEEAS